MKPSKNAHKGGAPAPKNGEGPGTRHTRALKINRKSKHAHDTGGLKNGKPLDSRSQVIAQANGGAKIGLSIYTSTPEKLQALKALRDEMPGDNGATQEKRILEALSRWSVTTYEASRYLDIYDPRARVMSLRNKGHDIVTSRVRQSTECGRLHRIGIYTLQRGATAVSCSRRPGPITHGGPMGTEALA
ncbi:helix-turn-helix domain-containing protein [Aquabacterium sp.]|uniref:helix-turn-helix domain-containing protein n=1 Tax=Aquabacterium sp. TaxID=1872578 RepID=UPI002487A83B|nr:helix-turn-helix domain-containing protein [Aquabacterium sp.]MDI1260246.1 helix-turn-helix domain-containing protein [Aquabacterium sp.]